MLRRLKDRAVPAGPRLYRLPLGIGRGLRIELDLRHRMRLYLGLYEIELNRHLRRLCPPGTPAFDVGGQEGYHALVLARLGRAPVVSFECEPEACARMERSFAANPSLRPPPRACCAIVGERTDARAARLTLDDAAFGPGGLVPGFVKIDIEGDEAAALRGAARLLAERRPGMIVETHGADVERECADLLRAAGYRVGVVEPRRWLADARPASHNRWLVAPSRNSAPSASARER